MKPSISLLKSLAAKPFVILTGNSGTGKTKLAELFAQWLCGVRGEEKKQIALIPVGADWTDNRNVLGFVNHIRLVKPLREPVEGESVEGEPVEGEPVEREPVEVPVYQTTGILDLLLDATVDPSLPFFLILDEMNLSHVERYFADFLSAMESRKGELHLHKEGRNLPRKSGGPADVPEILDFPLNVFVIGTVNIDETTYMFSPKVLDRANVIEFRVGADAAESFLASGCKPVAPIDPAPSGYSEAFLALSHRVRGLNGCPSLTLENSSLSADAKKSLVKCYKVIGDLFAVMQKCNHEFAFRSMAEMVRFLAVDYELASDSEKVNWNGAEALDTQILQKILPTLHGSKRKIGALLAALAIYCETGEKTDAEAYFADQYALETYVPQVNPLYKDSHRKLFEMILTIRRDQFVSFI